MTVKSAGKVSDESFSSKGKYSASKVKKVLELVSSECQFLLDYKGRASVLGEDVASHSRHDATRMEGS